MWKLRFSLHGNILRILKRAHVSYSFWYQLKMLLHVSPIITKMLKCFDDMLVLSQCYYTQIQDFFQAFLHSILLLMGIPDDK